MAFLRLNGVTIPVAQNTFEQEDQHIGFPFERAIDGTALTDRRAIKRRWRGRTIPLTEIQAEMFRGLINGSGQYFKYSSDHYSGSGLASASGTVTSFYTAAGDGTNAVDHNGVAYSKYGVGAIAVDTSTTNVLSSILTNGPNICTGTDTLSTTGGFTALNGATLTSDTSNYWQGSRSLKVDCDANAASQDGVRTAFGTVASNATVTGTVYVKGTGSVIVRLVQNSGVPAVLTSSSSVTLPTSGWRRIALTGTLTGGNTTAALQVDEATAGSDMIFYCDGFQIEQKAYPTSWVNGARSAGSLRYNHNPFSAAGATINMWLTKPSGTAAEYAFTSTGSSGNNNRISLGSDTSVTTLFLDTWDSSGTAHGLTSSVIAYTGWHMVTAVLRVNPETGENKKEIWFDGALVGSASPSGMPTLTDTQSFFIGHDGSSSARNARMDDVQVLPYAATSAMISGWYNLGTAVGALPVLIADGDFVADSSVSVIGMVERMPYVAHHNTTWRNNGRVLDFILEEV